MRLPDKKRPGNPILASDWNLLIEAIAARTPRPSPGLELVHGSGGFSYRLRQLAPGNAAAPAPHPFQILGSLDEGGNPRISINYGQITGWSLHANAAGTSPMLQAVHVDFLVGGSYAANHPQFTTVGYLPIAANTDHGVWLRANRGGGSPVFLDSGAGRGWDRLQTEVASDWQVVADTTDTAQSSKTGDNDFVWYFLGSARCDVAGDGAGTWTIRQYLRSDLNVPFGTLPVVTPSLDDGNSLSTSLTDGLLFVPPIVSNDEGNQLHSGSDGGAWAKVVDDDPANSISGDGSTGAFYEEPEPEP